MSIVSFLLVGLISFIALTILGRSALLIKRGQALSKNTRSYGQTPLHPRLSFLVAGDSTGFGTGALGNTGSVAGRLGMAFPDASLTNLSLNGLKTSELITRLESVGEKRFDLILLQIGGNDIIRFTPLEKLQEDSETLLEEARRHSSQVILVTSGDVGQAPFFWPCGFWWSWRTRAVRDIFQESASRHSVLYVDLLAAKVSETMSANPTRYYARDLLHPSAEGYGLWYRHIEPVVREAAKRFLVE